MTTGYCWHELFAWHDTGRAGSLRPGVAVEPYPHMEGPDAKRRLAALVEVSGLVDHLTRIPARAATEAELARVHDQRYIDDIRRQSEAGGGFADAVRRTPFGEGAFDIARLAAGSVIDLAEAVMTGQVDNGYALVRPPGHHAERDSGLGYCLFANIAVAIEALRSARPGLRVAVVDWDVHHGNGTQHLYESDPEVLAISIHEDGLFPAGSGSMDERGTGAGKGYTLNVPLPAGSGNGAYLEVLARVVVPALERLRPDLIFVACGLDAGAMDPHGHQTVTAAGYSRMTDLLLCAARDLCDGRIVCVHEGGYSPYYVPHCGLAVIERLSGHATAIEDPYRHLNELPSQAVTPAQRAVIDRASALR